jgi:hypothetical protein
MRQDLDSSTLFQLLEKVTERDSKEFEFLRTSVCIDPTFHLYYLPELRLPIRDNDLIRILIVYHFVEIDEYNQWYLRMALEDKFRNGNLGWMKILLENSVLFLHYLLERFRSPRAFLGFLDSRSMRNCLKSVRYRKIDKRVKKVQRKRGYTDKGSLKPSNKLDPQMEPHILSLKELEDRKLATSAAIEIFEGFIT